MRTLDLPGNWTRRETSTIEQIARQALRCLPIRGEDERADAMQTAALAAWEASRRLDPSRSESERAAYLTRAARQRVIDEFRKRGRWRTTALRSFAPGDPDAFPDAAMAAVVERLGQADPERLALARRRLVQLGEAIERAAERLAPQQRAFVEARLAGQDLDLGREARRRVYEALADAIDPEVADQEALVAALDVRHGLGQLRNPGESAISPQPVMEEEPMTTPATVTPISTTPPCAIDLARQALERAREERDAIQAEIERLRARLLEAEGLVRALEPIVEPKVERPVRREEESAPRPTRRPRGSGEEAERRRDLIAEFVARQGDVNNASVIQYLRQAGIEVASFDTTVRRDLALLAEAGRVVKIGHGRWGPGRVAA